MANWPILAWHEEQKHVNNIVENAGWWAGATQLETTARTRRSLLLVLLGITHEAILRDIDAKHDHWSTLIILSSPTNQTCDSMPPINIPLFVAETNIVLMIIILIMMIKMIPRCIDIPALSSAVSEAEGSWPRIVTIWAAAQYFN